MFRIPFVGSIVRFFVWRMIWRYVYRLVLVALLGYGGSHAFADTLIGRVVSVADGDTLTVLVGRDQFRVRLQGIDAPESKQAFGNVSKQLLSKLAFGKTVQVEFRQQDRYGRILGVVYADGRDLNLTMVGQGLAWHYKHYERDQAPDKRAAYAAAEENARTARLGLWNDRSPTPPWDFRRSGSN